MRQGRKLSQQPCQVLRAYISQATPSGHCTNLVRGQVVKVPGQGRAPSVTSRMAQKLYWRLQADIAGTKGW